LILVPYGESKLARQRLYISNGMLIPFDLLIVDEECRPLYAIDYQGGEHFKGAHATAARDAVKREELRRAGIGYVEVVAGDTPAELRRVVERLVQAPSRRASD